jgi:hypothetical protein
MYDVSSHLHCTLDTAQELAHKLQLMRINPEAGGLDLDNLWMTPQEKAEAKSKLKRMTRR